jgi:asparagine synthase (glutamine-hydrolysing)
MCGIIGKIGEGSVVDRSVFEMAVDEMSSRGPDGRGIWISDSVALGHRRLKILDLDDRSAQPFFSECKRYVLTYNGEIYNFQTLRAELEGKGGDFRTSSDTEVLLYGLVLEGISFVQKCIGMFAFCFYDRCTKEALLVRDRLGVKPLYYNFERGDLTFSSQLSALVRVSGHSGRLNRAAIASYLCFRYPAGKMTFFEGVHSLPAGNFLRFSGGSYTIESYWDCRDSIGGFTGSFSQAKDKTNDLFEQATRCRMVADVPVGAYLSGGVDSSALVAVSSNFARRPLSSFSIGFEHPNYNEFEYSDLVAKRYQADHTKVVLGSAEYIDEMERLIHLKGAPLSVPNEIPIYVLSRELKKKVTVVLSGEGADELFMGYGRIFRSAYDYQRLMSNDCSLAFREKFENHYGFLPQSKFDFFIRQYSYWGSLSQSALLTADFKDECAAFDTYSEFESYFDTVSGHDFEQVISYAFIKGHLPGLLQRLDNATMAAGVEGRVPFVDHRLVEFALSLPIRYKLAWRMPRADSSMLFSSEISEKLDCPKFMLKRAFERYLPKEVLNRRKLGFPVPLQLWFSEGFRDRARSLLLSQHSRTSGIFNEILLKQVFDGKELAVDHSLALKVWMMLNVELFLRKFF